MDYNNCPEKKIIEERLTRIEQVQIMRDEEQERAINGLATTMDNYMAESKKETSDLKKEINNLKSELPQIVKNELQDILDAYMLNNFKKSFKWFIVIIISSISYVFKSNIITFLKNLFH